MPASKPPYVPDTGTKVVQVSKGSIAPVVLSAIFGALFVVVLAALLSNVGVRRGDVATRARSDIYPSSAYPYNCQTCTAYQIEYGECGCSLINTTNAFLRRIDATAISEYRAVGLAYGDREITQFGAKTGLVFGPVQTTRPSVASQLDRGLRVLNFAVRYTNGWILHITPFTGVKTRHSSLADVLRETRAWSEQHPMASPIIVLLSLRPPWLAPSYCQGSQAAADLERTVLNTIGTRRLLNLTERDTLFGFARGTVAVVALSSHPSQLACLTGLSSGTKINVYSPELGAFGRTPVLDTSPLGVSDLGNNTYDQFLIRAWDTEPEPDGVDDRISFSLLPKMPEREVCSGPFTPLRSTIFCIYALNGTIE